MTKAEKLQLILSVITEDWCTYRNIHQRIEKKISVGEMAKILSNHSGSKECCIEHKVQDFGNKHYQFRMIFKKIKV